VLQQLADVNSKTCFYFTTFDAVGCGKSFHPRRAEYMNRDIVDRNGYHYADAQMAYNVAKVMV
jgi:hypothetical protein